MTNSIASAKCPVLSSGNYGLSQNRYTDESKEYIFVKLTDSAFRAVEEYQRNRNSKCFNNGQCAKIQFVENSGVIHFPTTDSSGEGRKFGFAIDDVDGSLECLQQNQHELDVLGSLSYRMRIQANEDVYDTTRTKMAIAEETEKSKCIREIKPNQTDIGRKVKKPSTNYHSTNYNNNNNSSSSNNSQPHNTNSNSSNNNHNSNISNNSYLSNSSSRSKIVSLSSSPPLSGSNGSSPSGRMAMGGSSVASSRSPNPIMLGGSGTINGSAGAGNGGGNSNRYSGICASTSSLSSSQLPTLTTASSLSSTLAGGISTGYASVSNSSPSDSVGKTNKLGSIGNYQLSNYSSSPRGSGNGGSGPLSGGNKTSMGSNSNKGFGNSSGGGGKLPDISRRKIRERLIHLLALKPFKKPELYARLHTEGLRDRERSLIGNILKDISTLSRDNTYNLRRQMWNDVNENWPYYTEQEVQQLKRRKPQNLTPPLSSDAGSSTSGQSPTSTHTGSPPPLINGGNGSGLKRASLECDRYEEGMNGLQPKKQRISHFKKDGIPAPARIGVSGSSTNVSTTSYGLPGRTSTLSPHIGLGTHGADDNSTNSDLSYSVLDNVEDFMSQIEQQGFYGNSSSLVGNGGRKSSNGNSTGNKNVGNSKEKRSSGSLATSVPNGGPPERSRNRELLKKATTAYGGVNSMQYGGSFVPETKSKGGANSRSSSVGNALSGSSSSSGGVANNGSTYQRQSPSLTQQHRKSTNSSVIHSPNKQTPANSQYDEYSRAGSGSNASVGKGGNGNSRYQPAVRSSPNKPSRTPTPPVIPQYQDPQQLIAPPHHQIEPPSQTQHHYPQEEDQPFQQTSIGRQQHASPTQQIADAASCYSTTTSEPQRYDFSNYRPITSIEQRRLYKTEFESDYDEYRKLLEQIESVGRRFRSLAERLENVRQGCPDYYNIKQQIVSEYERIRSEERLQRDKQRFDYLHEKLAYIKQLVTDYDKTLTSGAAVAAHQKHQQQQQVQMQRHQQQIQQQRYLQQPQTNSMDSNLLGTSSRHHARLSPMVMSGGESHSPPTAPVYQQPLQQQNHHQQSQQQQHQQQVTAQHHDAETILETAAEAAASLPALNPEHVQPQNHNRHSHHHQHDHNGEQRDTDSDDGSDSSSNDDDDDDDNDENSNSNSNDDDNDY